jgi:hypothetical protein
MYEKLISCRVCNNQDLKEYIDLGFLPLSNNLMDSPIQQAERFPLKVLFCDQCGLSQLSIVINPEILFGHYVYRSGINQGYVNHCRDMAKELKEQYGLTDNSFMVDIAGNDGSLLNQFKEEIGLNILNIDPAVNLGAICESKGIPALTYFWGSETARRIVNGFEQADLITATNVFAHVHDVHDFIEGAKIALKPSGVLVLEFPYLIDFIDKNEFDTIYHEHLSYFSIKPLDIICKDHQMNIIRIEHQDIHGGSLRVHIGFSERSGLVDKYIFNESNYDLDILKSFADDSRDTIRDFRDRLNKLKSDGKKIAAFACSAKGNTLMNCAGLTVGTISYIVDDTPEKIGKYSPGTFIPIVSLLELKSNPPDYLILLSWNFTEALIERSKSAGYAGRYIVPIPTFKVLE